MDASSRRSREGLRVDGRRRRQGGWPALGRSWRGKALIRPGCCLVSGRTGVPALPRGETLGPNSGLLPPETGVKKEWGPGGNPNRRSPLQPRTRMGRPRGGDGATRRTAKQLQAWICASMAGGILDPRKRTPSPGGCSHRCPINAPISAKISDSFAAWMCSFSTGFGGLESDP